MLSGLALARPHPGVRTFPERQHPGHSLIELLVVIAIIAIMIGMILAVFIAAYRTVQTLK